MHGRAMIPSPIHSRRPALLAWGGSSSGGDAQLMHVGVGAGRNVTRNVQPFLRHVPRSTCASLFRTRAMTGHAADLETVAALLRGEHTAFTSLVRAHQPAFLRLAHT